MMTCKKLKGYDCEDFPNRWNGGIKCLAYFKDVKRNEGILRRILEISDCYQKTYQKKVLQ